MMRALCLALLLAVVSPGAALAQEPHLATLVEAAQGGNTEAQFLLAERYRRGDGVLQSYARAAQLYATAAQAGDARALYRLGRQLVAGLGVEADAQQGYALLTRAAQSGAPEHLFALANAYQAGIAGPPDLARAAELFALAAEGGWDEAAVALGTLYYEGAGVQKDVEQAVALYAGPAERGNALAQNNLGLIHARGDLGQVDYAEALKWFQLASTGGLSQGMRNLAALYENGFGVEVDEKRAQALLRLAAEGDVLGLFSDARLRPVEPERIAEYAQAAQSGDPIASFNLGLALMATEEISVAQQRAAADAFALAARRGLPAAMANYGLMFFEGRGVLQDFTEGYAWLTVAVSMGLPDALELRDQLGRSMTVGQINAAQSLAEGLWQEITGRAP